MTTSRLSVCMAQHRAGLEASALWTREGARSTKKSMLLKDSSSHLAGVDSWEQAPRGAGIN